MCLLYHARPGAAGWRSRPSEAATASSRSICASAAGVRPEVWERESTFERGRESPLWRCSMIPSKKLRRIASVMQIKHSQVA